MAITSYSELQTAVANWLNRNDLASRIPEFIALAEGDINAQFNLRTLEQSVTATTTIGSRFMSLPSGFRDPLNFWIHWSFGYGEPIRFVTPELLTVTDVAAVPTAWCIDGDNIAFNCPTDQAYTVVLRERTGVALSDGDPTNLVLTNYPSVYLYGALRHAATYLRDPDLLQTAEALWEQALADAKAKEGRVKALVTLSTEPGALTFYGRRHGFNINRGW